MHVNDGNFTHDQVLEDPHRVDPNTGRACYGCEGLGVETHSGRHVGSELSRLLMSTPQHEHRTRKCCFGLSPS